MLLREWLPALTPEGRRPRAIDIACGLGRNSIFLARHGWQVTAVDISEVALGHLRELAAAEALPIVCRQADLEQTSRLPESLLAPDSYDLAVMFRYTSLELIEPLRHGLRIGGGLIVEEHMTTEAQVIGPQDPRFRVAPGALREAASRLDIIDYREGVTEDPDGRPAALAQLVARRAV